MDFNSIFGYDNQINQWLVQIDRIIDDFLASESGYAEKFFPRINMENSKHLRSRLLLLFRQAVGYPVTQTDLHLAAAVEMTHTLSLVFDDLIDNRPGRLSERLYPHSEGNSQKIRQGLVIYSELYRFLCKLGQQEWIELFSNTINSMSVGELAKGQYSQDVLKPGVDQYILAIHGTTAALFNLSARLALRDVIESEKFSDLLEEFSLCFGLAYQICDDLRDLKEDYLNGTWTLPFLIYSQDGNEIVLGEGALPLKDIAENGALNKTLSVMNENLDRCYKILKKLEDPDACSDLERICKWMNKEVETFLERM